MIQLSGIFNKNKSIKFSDDRKELLIGLFSELIMESLRDPNIDSIENISTEAINWLRKQSTEKIILSLEPKELECPVCKNKMIIKDKKQKIIYGLSTYKIDRRNFHCDTCDHYIRPLDNVLNCVGHYTLELRKSMLLLGQRLPFEEASIFLKELLGISVSHKTIRELTEKTGYRLNSDEEKRIEELVNENGQIKDAIVENRNRKIIPGTAYMELDGCMVQTREDGWKEARNGIIFSENNVTQKDKHHIKIIDKKCFSEFNNENNSLDNFKKRATQEAWDFGFHRYKNHVIIGDGAIYIWDYASMHHPTAIQILDYYHASEYLGNAISSLNLEDSDENKLIKNTLFLKLESGKIKSILAWLQQQKITEQVENCIRYYDKNKERMQYGKYKKMELNVGSGAIESTHKVLVQSRMKQAGMRWGKDNIQSIVALRARYLSNEWDYVVDNYLKVA